MTPRIMFTILNTTGKPIEFWSYELQVIMVLQVEMLLNQQRFSLMY